MSAFDKDAIELDYFLNEESSKTPDINIPNKTFSFKNVLIQK
jgi:hypothetical protein